MLSPTLTTSVPATARTCSAKRAASGQSCAPSPRVTTREARGDPSAEQATEMLQAPTATKPATHTACKSVGIGRPAVGFYAFLTRLFRVVLRALGDAIRTSQL